MRIPFTSETGLLEVNRFLTMPGVNEEVALLVAVLLVTVLLLLVTVLVALLVANIDLSYLC